MDELLDHFCNLLKIDVVDFKGDSRANKLPACRHIFYYCVKTSFANVRLRHIAAIANKKPSGVSYGVKTIAYLMTPINKTGCTQNIFTPQMQTIKDYVANFLAVCEKYRETGIKLPQK